MRRSLGWSGAAFVLCAVLSPPAVAQQGQVVEPYFLIMTDTSGSMGVTDCADCPSGTCSIGCDTVPNSCGQPPSRLNAAKCVLTDLVNAYGDVQFGLGRFSMFCGDLQSGPGTDYVYLSECTDGSDPTNPANEDPGLGEILAPIAPNNQASVLDFVDFAPSYADPAGLSCPEEDPPEIVVNDELYGLTPLAATLNAARRYYEGGDPSFSSPIAGDSFAGCRPYYVILLTDGLETCAEHQDAIDAADALRTTSVPGAGTFDIRTFVIAFGVPQPTTEIEQIATAGGTQALYAQNEEELALAFADVIGDSLLVEECDNDDNDCDGQVDEGFVKYCDLESGITGQELCTDPGDPCDDEDDNCHLGTDDEPTNDCGFCGPAPDEVCNSTDDDCDGFIDEGNVCAGCSPEAEICDGKDNDCDGAFDEGVTRACGSDVGQCTPGTQSCVEQTSEQPDGEWGPCSGDGPTQEICDGLDNDCDGLVDGLAQECYGFQEGCTVGGGCEGICQTGNEICTGGSFGDCEGDIGPQNEICNLLDDDCDGSTDEGNPGGGDPCTTSCGAGVTECQNGMIVCVGGGNGMPEECNATDDDCDGVVDEDVGTMGPCDEDGTLCVPGELQCVGGVWQCVGGVPPEPEACDCEDNDCDGSIDEGPDDSLCPSGASCLGDPHCLCARPCEEGEFPCPSGHNCVDVEEPAGDFCVPNPCFEVECGAGEVCQDGDCVLFCDTISCPDGFACRPEDGACVEDNCNGFPERCGEEELCLDGACIDDPCTGVECPGGEFCREGDCVPTCAGVDCPSGTSCDLGMCVDDPCAGTSCQDFSVCDPATSDCVQDECVGVSCGAGQVCDPLTGECERDPCLGVECPEGQVCEDGNCWDRPQDEDPEESDYLTAAGGGGCTCRAGPRAPGLAVGLLLLLAAAVLRRRRRR